MLSFHTDFISNSGLTESSSLWVGAWWPGFLLTFMMALLSGFFILCYPSIINKNNNCQKQSISSSDKKENLVVNFGKEILSLLKNLTYVLVSLAMSVDAIIVAGLATFLPKYLESQFQLSTGAAAQMVGLMVVPAGGSATLLSGIFLKKFVKTRNGAITLCIIAHSIALPLIFIFLMSCPSLTIDGQSSSVSSSPLSSSLSVSSQCNIDCSCSTSSLDPVCGSDGVMYLSPCLAGCKDSPGREDQLFIQNYFNVSGYNNFTSCSCIGDSGSAIRQQCDNECGVFIPFVVVTFILIFLTFWVTMPSTMATLRCVREQERSLALGLQNIFIRLLGTIPGPVMFGYYIDNTCTLWNKSCGEFNNSEE